jgi:hypothetical protein
LLKSFTKVPYQLLFNNWLKKETAAPPFKPRARGQPRRDRRQHELWQPYVPPAKVSLELQTGHSRHIDVSDQAELFDEAGKARKLAADEKVSTL